MSETVIRPKFDDVFLKEAEGNTVLGPTYFDAREVVDKILPARVADLEAEVASLKEDNRRLRDRY